MGQDTTLGQKCRYWISAARPRTLFTGISPVLIAMGLAYPLPWFNWQGGLGCLLIAMGLQIAANFTNDADDAKSGADNAKRKGPKRFVASGLISLRAMRVATIMVLALVGVVAYYTIPWEMPAFWAVGASAVVAMLAYTGLGIAYGYKGLGELICFIFFGPVAVVGTYIICAGSYSIEAIFMGLACGFMSVALLEVNNIRDIHTDKRSGKNTLAVKLGRKKAVGIYKWSVLLAMMFTAFLTVEYFWVWPSVVVLMLLGARCWAVLNKADPFDGATHNNILAKTSLTQLLWAISAILGFIISLHNVLGKIA